MLKMPNVADVRGIFRDKLRAKDFTTDKSGVKVIELIGIAYEVDEPVIFGKLNEDYAQRELQWYLSQSRNVHDIPGKCPKIWEMVADKDGLINSNYGWCIFSDENNNQYNNVLNELRSNPESRRAQMIYTRPQMWNDYNRNGMSDFMCTTAVEVFIRGSILYYVINQRSCDAVYGFKNDIFWHKWVAKKLLNDLQLGNSVIKIIHQVGSLHLYERHFSLVNI